MKSNGLKKAAVIMIALLELQWPGSAAPARMRVLQGHVIPQIQKSTRLGRVSAEETVDLGLVVQVDQIVLDQTLAEIYGRQAKNPGHFLSSAEFSRKFGLAEKRKNLKDFAAANGLSVNAADDRADSMIVKVSGHADAVEKAFQVQLNRYQSADGKTFRAHETDPMVPEAVASNLSAVLGLSNLTGVARPHLHVGRLLTGRGAAAASSASTANSFTGSFLGAINPSDIKTIYSLNTPSQNGAGQNVAIFELDGYNPADIAAYQAQFILPAIPLTFIGVDGQTNVCGSPPVSCATQDPTLDNGMVEVALDIEMVSALATNASNIYVYDSPNTFTGVIDQYDRIATDNLASVVSTSWGLFETAGGGAFSSAEAPIFQRMAAQGQAVFAASGDNGAFDNGSTLSVDDPASQLYVTGVGGTSLSGTPASHTETAWDGSGGGVGVGSIPSYQSGVPGMASQAARNVPDVSLNADPNSGYAVFVGGSSGGGWFQVGGTSAAAPLWAALMTLVNQYRATLGNVPLGFANPTFYQIQTSGVANNFLNDITSGNNFGYSAKAGYDNVTGCGSYKGSALITALGSVSNFATLYNLSDVYPYPNPWDIRRNAGSPITIANVPPGSTVKIFTVSGLLVKTVPVISNNAVWDLTNDSGRTVASGLYIYLVINNDKKNIGKIAIIK